MNIQLDLFTTTELEKYTTGSKEWRKAKYKELHDLPMQTLEEMQFKGDYYTDVVIIDILHYDKIEEFQKKYPKALVYKRKPFYLD